MGTSPKNAQPLQRHLACASLATINSLGKNPFHPESDLPTSFSFICDCTVRIRPTVPMSIHFVGRFECMSTAQACCDLRHPLAFAASDQMLISASSGPSDPQPEAIHLFLSIFRMLQAPPFQRELKYSTSIATSSARGSCDVVMDCSKKAIC